MAISKLQLIGINGVTRHWLFNIIVSPSKRQRILTHPEPYMELVSNKFEDPSVTEIHVIIAYAMI